MNKAFEKILELIKQNTIQNKDSISFFNECGVKFISAGKAKEIVKEVAEDYKGGWIPCSERLPKVPKGIDDAECPEFNVTINGAEESTILKYSWDGTWFDDSGNLYDVIAWQPMPQLYEEGKQCQE